jgi:hypothetical protein
VIAQLQLVKHAGAVFGWTINIERIDELITVARELNEEAAHSDDTDPNVAEKVDN